MPPGKRVGFAIVGLGRLSLEELLPAFGETKKARVVALMSGTPDKARLVAEQYGIAPDAIYGYDEWDRLAQNPAVQVGLRRDAQRHASRPGRRGGAGPASTCSARSRWPIPRPRRAR